MRKKLLGILSLVVALMATSCLNAPDEKSEEQIKSDKFIEEIAKGGEYTEYKHLNHTTPIYYKVLKASETPDGQRPYQNSEVKVVIKGKFVSGEVFQPEQKMTITIFDISADGSPVGIVRGLQYALQKMTIGDKWEVVVPYDLGYGRMKNGRIPAYSTLIFEVELLEIIKL